MDEPKRPRLADHVALRRHRVGGETVVVLHDMSSGGQAQVGAREHLLLSHADGSRDVEGIVAAAATDALWIEVADAAGFFARLAAAGMLVDGIAPAPPMGAVAPPIDRPLLRMPGFSLRCDGGGSCCRIYPTTSFAPLERLRARSLAPERLDCGRDTRGAFTPERGSSFVPWRAASVCQVDGRCAFLDGEERCTLHERGGAEGKPLGCRLFPARLVDDGEVVRVAPAPECACVFASASSRTGEPLLDETITQRADLDPAIHVDALAPADAASGEQLARALQDAGEDGFDALEWLCGQAQTLTGAQRLDAAKQTLTLGVKRHLAMQHWRAPSDLARRLPEWMLAANGHGAAPTADDATGRDERFYLRCIVFGRLWLLDDAEPGDALWARAARLWCARAMHAVPMTGVPQSVAAHPLAGVEALARGFGW